MLLSPKLNQNPFILMQAYTVLLSRQLGLTAMPSQADIMRAFCVEASVDKALEDCGEALVKQHGLPPPPNGPSPSSPVPTKQA